MDDICNAAGRSIGNIYYYFKSKEDLFVNLGEQFFTDIQQNIKRICSEYNSTTDRLYAYGEFIAGIERPLNSVEKEFVSIVGVESDAGKQLGAIINQVFEEFQKLVSEGIAMDELKDENLFDMSFIISTFYNGLGRYTAHMDKDTRKAIIHKGITLLLQGISNRN
jgi:AcrR family transcriptional regulator